MSQAAADTCAFTPLCQRELSGPPLDEAEATKLEAHLSTGCKQCEELFELHLSGSDEAEAPGADLRRELDRTLATAMAAAADAMAERERDVLAKVEERVRREAWFLERRARRRHLRVVFYMTSLVCCVLLGVAYIGLATAVKVKQRQARSEATKTELAALRAALVRWVKDHQAVPQDEAAFLAAMAARRPGDDESAYYPLDPNRRTQAGYLDDFGRPYRYLPGKDKALVYSVGPDGKDDQGEPDDLGQWVHFIHGR